MYDLEGAVTSHVRTCDSIHLRQPWAAALMATASNLGEDDCEAAVLALLEHPEGRIRAAAESAINQQMPTPVRPSRRMPTMELVKAMAVEVAAPDLSSSEWPALLVGQRGRRSTAEDFREMANKIDVLERFEGLSENVGERARRMCRVVQSMLPVSPHDSTSNLDSQFNSTGLPGEV